MVIEMVKDFPQSLMSLGEDSLTLMHSIIQGADDLRLAKRMLELYEKSDITPLLPYGPKVGALEHSASTQHTRSALKPGDAGRKGLWWRHEAKLTRCMLCRANLCWPRSTATTALLPLLTALWGWGTRAPLRAQPQWRLVGPLCYTVPQAALPPVLEPRGLT